MKKFARILGYIVAFLLLLVLLLFLFDYGYVLRGAKITYLSGHTTAYIDDYTHFPNRKIEAGKDQPWPQTKDYNSAEPTEKLQELNEELGTAAFLIIKNDSIWFEKYYEKYGPKSKTNSFSMAKSIVSALLGKAIMEGYIKSLDEPVADFYPQFDPALTVGDLSSMASGLNWDESYYNPFGQTAKAYFGKDIRELILNLKVTSEPGRKVQIPQRKCGAAGNGDFQGYGKKPCRISERKFLEAYGNAAGCALANRQPQKRYGKGLLLYRFQCP